MKDFKMDKTGWKTYRFDEFAQNISERIEPRQTDLTVYVGLEHLDPDCIHIKRHGSPSDVEGIKLKFYKGDIIFGKRRAYQRKSGLATTNGICSAHAMVLRAREDVIDPRLFPFIFHSKVFIDKAITISVGGLSPTINWKDLAKQEFCLPPKEEQIRLAELLWAADEVVEREVRLKCKLKMLFNFLLQKVFDVPSSQYCRLDKIANITMGQSPDGQSYNETGNGILFLQGNAEFGDIHPHTHKYTNKPNKFAEKGDVLMSVRAPVGAINIADQKYCIGRGLCALSLKKGDNNFLKYFLIYSLPYLEKQSTGSTFKAINANIIKSLQVPSIKNIDDLILLLTNCENQIENLKEQILHSQQLKQNIINQIF